MTVHRNRKRPYTLGRRAASQAETRQRIVEAAVELHGTLGPAQTTISAIAERAAVQRLTVYRHFPDERSLLHACSSHARALMPAPDAEAWRAILDPERRLRTALGELYPYFRRAEPFWANVLRDADLSPIVKEMAAKRRWGYLAVARDTLVAGWRRPSARLTAALGHAVDFRAWESLARRQGLNDAQAADLMTTFVQCVRRSSATPAREQRRQRAPVEQPRQTPRPARRSIARRGDVT